LVNRVEKDLHIHSDPDLVQLVMRNLLTNAFKFSHRGGEVELDADVSEGYVLVRITDHGTGISPEKMKNLFAFSGKSKRGTENEAGTGLGLTLSREVVRLLGGEIWVTSKEGEGSCFQFRIPATGDQ